MNVKELIEILSKFDQELPVLIYDPEWGYFSCAEPTLESNVEEVSLFFNSEGRKIHPNAVVL